MLITVLAIMMGALAQDKEKAMAQDVRSRAVKENGLNIFYREAGSGEAPNISMGYHLRRECFNLC